MPLPIKGSASSLSWVHKIILMSKISILIFNVFHFNIKKNWTFENIITFLNEFFLLGEKMNARTEDVQWLFNFPKLFISTTHINKYIEFTINDSRCLWYSNFLNTPTTILIYFHGGGYCSCSPEAYFGFIDRIDNNIDSSKTNFLFMDYPKAPEFKYPLAINICYQKYYYLTCLFPNTSFVFMGDSSGANLLLQLTNKIIKENIKKPKALICLSPWVITNIKKKYWKENMEKDFITPFAIDLAIKSYLNYDIKNIESILDFNYDIFPPIFIRAGGNELILDEILVLISTIENSKCKLQYKIIKDMPHAFDVFHGLIINFDSDFKGLIEYINLAII